MRDQKAYWLGFNLVKGIGAVRLQALLNHFGDVEKAWHATPNELSEAGLGSKVINTLVQVRSDVSLDQLWENIQKQDIQVVIWGDNDYPLRLMEIDYPPPVLYVRGRIIRQDEWAVAIVGTRRVTAYGRNVTEQIAGILAGSGVTIVSGLARGIDSIAHQAALEAGGRTLAVLGSGVDRIYPPENRSLAERMVESGALISDYALGTPPDSVNFPPRNRIISGISLAVIIVEAGNRSGALITAQFAADQGREVFAVPGNITAPQSVGTNRLIRDGARPLLNPQEVLELLDLTMMHHHKEARVALPIDETETRLLDLLRNEPRHVDDICNQVQLPIERVTATLAMMELKGIVRQMGGMQYIAVHEEPGEYLI